MDSYYTSIPLMLQLEYYGVIAIGTVNIKRKGLGQEFSNMKKQLQKNYDAGKGRKNSKAGGFVKGFYKARAVDDEPLIIVIQKDSKVMTYLSNFLSTAEKAPMNR